MSESRPKYIRITLSVAEYDAITHASAREGDLTTTFVRRAALRAAQFDPASPSDARQSRAQKRAVADARSRDEDYINLNCGGIVPADFEPSVPGDVYDRSTRRMVPATTTPPTKHDPAHFAPDDLPPEVQAALDAIDAEFDRG